MGIKFTKVRRIIKFKQDYIFKDYFELNSKMRTVAKTEVEKDILMLMINSLFGKLYLGATVLELGKLHMYELFCNVSKPSLRDLNLHYMDTDSFVLCVTGGNVPDEYMDLSNLDTLIEINNKVPGKFKHEMGKSYRRSPETKDL